jgi:DNA-directed RNA polymerase subunit beta'
LPAGWASSTPGAEEEAEELIRRCYQVAGHEETVRTLTASRTSGFEHATLGASSIGIVDMIVPEAKVKTVEAARKSLAEVEAQVPQGHITGANATKDHRHLDARHG